MMGRGSAGLIRFPVGSFYGCGQQIIHETASLDIALLVVVDFLV